MAYLDVAPASADRHGGVSDPRLVAQVGAIPEITPEQTAAAAAVIDIHARDRFERSTFRAMLGIDQEEAA